MKPLPLLLLGVCIAAISPRGLAADEEVDADAYTTCAACHLIDGVGIPGAFPPINDRTAAMAALDGGRDYLIMVVSYGLMGTIEAGGSQYMGIMPGNKGMMAADDIAAALNYVVFELSDSNADIAPFTSDEVEAVQSAARAAGPNTAAEIRQKLIEQHEDEWPK